MVIFGVTPGTVSSNPSGKVEDEDVVESEAQEDSVVEKDFNPKKPVVIQSFNVSNGQTKTVTTTQPILERAKSPPFVRGVRGILAVYKSKIILLNTHQ